MLNSYAKKLEKLKISTSSTSPRKVLNPLVFRGAPFNPSLVRDELLHEMFETTAQKQPAKRALLCGEIALTYSELDYRANQLAHYLQTLGVKKGDFVGIYLPRGIDVYIALLAILKTGAAYLPFDPEFPLERIAYGIEDTKAKLLITDTQLIAKETPLACPVAYLKQLTNIIKRQSSQALNKHELGLTSDDTAYAICTSGTTGRPKCVEISHRSVCNLVRAEDLVLGVKQDDIFYQGFSLAFDASIEEIWLTFLVGATLFVGTSEIVHSGPELADILTRAKVTILSCVPTLLSMVENDIPTVRQINFAGEVLPLGLLKRWSKPGRKIFNTYGPTEATVTSTYMLVDADEPITIGKPLPNYTAYILDENMQLVPIGKKGELYIGGVGVAKGYVGKPELTAQKFVYNPYYDEFTHDPILYKTGDLACFTPEGNIEFFGRIDTQIKLRGFRIELAEIEQVILEQHAIKSTVVALHIDNNQIDRLVAYVVMCAGEVLDRDKVKAYMAKRLAPYMVPSIIQQIDALPMLASGKVDRKKLPAPELMQIEKNIMGPTNVVEKVLIETWATLFPEFEISIDHNFFYDLGGHSLLAAQFVSLIRKIPGYQQVGMLDIYNYPSIRLLASHIMQKNLTENVVKESQQTASAVYLGCGLAQGIALFFILGFYCFTGIFGPYMIYHWMVAIHYEPFYAALYSLGSLFIFIPIIFMLPILGKWLIIGRYKSGEYPLWGTYYFRWWLVSQMTAMVPTGYLAGSPALSIYLRLLGAKIGKNVYIGDDAFDAFDLIEIGDNSSLGKGSVLLNTKIENGMLKIGSIKIRKNCFIGASCVIERNTVLQSGAILEDLSMLAMDSIIPHNQAWQGSPAKKTKKHPLSNVLKNATQSITKSKCFTYGLAQSIILFLFPSLVMIPLFPAMGIIYLLNPSNLSTVYIVYAPLFALSYIIIFCLEVIALKWSLLGKVKPGRYSIYSGFYLRKWVVDQVLDLSISILLPLFGTLYLPIWYRLLGMKLGKGSEVSTATSINHDLTEIGEYCFIADGVYLGVQRIQNSWLVIVPSQLGKRTFIGNSAMLSTGAKIGEHSLIGCLSTPPNNMENANCNQSSWLGSPPILLPKRQQFNFTDAVTFHPSRYLYMQRLLIELIRIIFPLTCYTMLFVVMLAVCLKMDFDYHYPLWKITLVFPVLSLGFGLSMLFITYLVKKILIGTYKTVQEPLWSNFVWRSELVTAIYESLVAPFLMSMLVGTPFINWALRLLGCKIGKQVFTNTTDITEFDLVEIGDYAQLNYGCDLQTHLFEDRVMKVSKISIGNRCTIGALSIILYDSVMEEGSELGSLSLLMKGETLPAYTQWAGSPCRPI